MRPAEQKSNKDSLIRNDDDLHRREEHCCCCYKNGNEMNQDRSSSFFRLTAQRMMISIRPILNWRRCFLLLSIILCCSESLFFFLPVVSGSPATMTNTAALGRLVKTRYGLLRGITLQGGVTQPSPPSPTGTRFSSNKQVSTSVDAFLGVPYAAPPVGPLRFLPPASTGPWTGTRMAITLPPACPQQMPSILSNRTASLQTMPRARYYQLKRMQAALVNQSEDCLYLNLYAPNEGYLIGTLLPVIVLIHGESYSWGAGHLMDGGLLAVKTRAIVVTLNYRLGILGFLQTGASPTPGQARGKSKAVIPTQGNYGLLDIMASLLWLKDNVAGFGGDPSKITLSGHGTGAALANLLMISPLASGLFQRVILMAGSALSPWALNPQAGWLKMEVGRQLDCPTVVGGSVQLPELADIGDCLRKRSLEQLLSLKLPATPRFCPTFAPFVDGAGIVAMDPLQAMQSASQDFARIPLVAGVASVESYRDIGDADLRNGISEDRRDRSLRTLIRNFYQYHLNEIFYVLRNEYTDWDRPSALDPLSMRDSLSSALSDALVVAPLMHVVHLHATRSANPSSTFLYHFQGPDSLSPDGEMDSTEYQKLGSVTGDELEELQLDVTVSGGYGGAGLPRAEPSSPSSGSMMSGNGSDVVMSDSNQGAMSKEHPAGSHPSLVQFLAAFASTGDPNLEIGSKGELMPQRSKLRWEPFNLHSQYYMVLGGRNPHMKSHYRGHHVAVWLQLIPQLHQPGGVAEVPIGIHHQFDGQDPSTDQLYEGIVRVSGVNTGRILLTTPTAPSSECGSNATIRRTNSTSSAAGSDWAAGAINPNVMASEPDIMSAAGGTGSSPTMSSTVENQDQDRSASGTGGSFFVSMTNQAALSITLVVGTFFLVLNLLLFAAIYRRNRSSSARRANRTPSEPKHQQDGNTGINSGTVPVESSTSIESVTDLRQFIYHQHQHANHHPADGLPAYFGSHLHTRSSTALSDLSVGSSSRNNVVVHTISADGRILQQQQPVLGRPLTSSFSGGPPPPPPFPNIHHQAQFLLEAESDVRRSATLPGRGRTSGGGGTRAGSTTVSIPLAGSNDKSSSGGSTAATKSLEITV